MVFNADTAFALILISLGIGFWVLVKARSENAGNLRGFGTFLGYFIIVLAFLLLLCAGYYSVRYWEDGHFNKPHAAAMAFMPGGGMMMGHGGGCGHGMMMCEGKHARDSVMKKEMKECKMHEQHEQHEMHEEMEEEREIEEE